MLATLSSSAALPVRTLTTPPGRSEVCRASLKAAASSPWLASITRMQALPITALVQAASTMPRRPSVGLGTATSTPRGLMRL